MAAFEDSTNFLETLAPQIEAKRTLAYEYAMPDCEGWEETWQKHGITASKRNMDGNAICVRGQTNYPNTTPLAILKTIQNVTEVDDAMKQHDFLAKLSPTVAIEHVFVNVPWPVTPRDGLSACFIDVLEDGTVSQISFGIECDAVCPPIKGHIRSDLTIAAYIMKPDGQGGTNATYMLQVRYCGGSQCEVTRTLSSDTRLHYSLSDSLQ